MSMWSQVADLLSLNASCVLITIQSLKGSSPRDVGTQMVVVMSGEQWGTIGGGALEWQATKQALELLQTTNKYLRLETDFILGPDLEQCCGGHVVLSFEVLTPNQLQTAQQMAVNDQQQNPKQHLMLFGAGHVAQALVQALSPLDFKIDWFDSRPNIFPPQDLHNVAYFDLESLEVCFEKVRQNSFAVIMTHDHQLDFEVSIMALQNPKIAFVGLIGSATKKARFCKRFGHQGLSHNQIDRLVCPIGVSGISDKSPAGIAASVTAQLLQQTQLLKIKRKTVHLVKNRA